MVKYYCALKHKNRIVSTACVFPRGCVPQLFLHVSAYVFIKSGSVNESPSSWEAKEPPLHLAPHFFFFFYYTHETKHVSQILGRAINTNVMTIIQ